MRFLGNALVSELLPNYVYREGHRSPFIDDEIFEEALRELVDSFSEEWITSNSGHPLQILWHRRDILASIELAMLGLSIRKIKRFSPDQVKQNIRIIKSDDQGNMRNAAWEIILAASFHTPPKQYSRLLGPHKPTYDIEVEFPDNSKNHISVRTFGQSEKYIEFSNQFESVERIIKNNMKVLCK